MRDLIELLECGLSHYDYTIERSDACLKIALKNDHGTLYFPVFEGSWDAVDTLHKFFEKEGIL